MAVALFAVRVCLKVLHWLGKDIDRGTSYLGVVVCFLTCLEGYPSSFNHEKERALMKSLLHSCQFRCMAAFPPSVHAPKRVAAGFREEPALIPSLEMAATDVQACRSKHATRKPVTVETFVSKFGVFASVCDVDVHLFGDAATGGLVKMRYISWLIVDSLDLFFG